MLTMSLPVSDSLSSCAVPKALASRTARRAASFFIPASMAAREFLTMVSMKSASSSSPPLSFLGLETPDSDEKTFGPAVDSPSNWR